MVLCEKDDLAAHTSSASTKLIHGGLRYLEHYEFRLVAEALREREVLLRAAPHIVWPMRFVLPHDPSMRPKWLLRAGLLLYDTLGGFGRTLPGSRAIRLDRPPHRGLVLFAAEVARDTGKARQRVLGKQVRSDQARAPKRRRTVLFV